VCVWVWGVCVCVCVCVCVWKVWTTSGRVEGERRRPRCGVVVDGLSILLGQTKEEPLRIALTRGG
jgi:hypothetical protein